MITTPFLIVLFLALQEPRAAAPKSVPQPQDTPAQSPDRNAPDPFRPDESMRGIVGDEPRSGADFTPLDHAPTMPSMRVRGIVKMKSRPKPAAILEIEGIGRYTVREGERISFSLPGRFTTSNVAPGRTTGESNRRTGVASTPGSTQPQASQLMVRQQIPIVLRVETIAADGVIVEVGTLGERLIIR